MKHLKTRTIWIITGVIFLITIGLLFSIAFTSGVLNKVVLYSMIACFIILTLLIQYASFRTFQFKHKIKYPTKTYLCSRNIEEILKELNFKKRTTNYGLSYLLIKDKVAYKVVLIDDAKKYFTPTEEKPQPKNKALDECESFIAFELFYDIDEEVNRKIVEFSIQGDKVYYTAFSKNDVGFYCHNYLKPEGIHVNNYNKLIEMLEFKEE